MVALLRLGALFVLVVLAASCGGRMAGVPPAALMRALEPTGEWSGFVGDGAEVSMDDPGRRLFVDVDGTRVLDVEAPWWSAPMPDQAGTHDNGACADESVEIMAAWISAAQRRVVLAVQVDFPPCQHTGGFYLVGW